MIAITSLIVKKKTKLWENVLMFDQVSRKLINNWRLWHAFHLYAFLVNTLVKSINKTKTISFVSKYTSICPTRFYMQILLPISNLLFFSDMLIKLFSNTDQIGGQKHPIFILQIKAFWVIFSNNAYLDPELVIHFWGKRLSKLRGNHSATRRTVYWN